MVKQQRLKITLHDDALFSASSATEGGLRTLDYIPGAALLGAAAASCYGGCSDAWNLFHSGAVRFGDGIPLHENGLPAWPAPLTWQRPKEGSYVDEKGRLREGVALANASAGEVTRGLQRKPLRGTYITADGHIVRLTHRISLKTAINPDTGRIATGQLFQYESLVGNVQFAATLSWDDGHDVLASQVLKALCGGTVALGRSRSAEYGGATVELLDDKTTDWPRLPGTDCLKHVSLWCLSDLCLIDAKGQPCLSPTVANLGLPVGQLVAARSYIQTRAYSPFNAHRQAYDIERQVITRGSVLTFEFDEPQTIASLNDKLLVGVGLHREAGLGVLSADHAWQKEKSFEVTNTGVFAEFVDPQSRKYADASPNEADSSFLAWLTARCNVTNVDANRRVWAQGKHKIVRAILASARKLSSQSAEQTQPSATQWGNIRERARGVVTSAGLMASLAGPGGPLFGAKNSFFAQETPEQVFQREKARTGKNSVWFAAAFLVTSGLDGRQRNRSICLGDWLLAELVQLNDENGVGEYLAALAALARSAAQSDKDGRVTYQEPHRANR